ncbi:substrate-binding domain-containing protein [Actinomadura hibisca]|uniref:substrate-binding domain-containing protein n=1 Tax=Actinomadura hibisca TaxID=68565 RepID=UPI000A00F393|nr:substrate-binding domain-containing protein [Actinomadura hibisca]
MDEQPTPGAAPPPRPWWRRPVAWGAAATLTVTAAGGAVWASGVFEGACGSELDITVAAQPEATQALREIADRFSVENHRVAGRCVRVQVMPTEPAYYLRDETVRQVSDAWVPESSLWFKVAGDAGLKGVPKGGPSIATSPVVLATPRAVGEEFADAEIKPSWKLLLDDEAEDLPLERRAADPAASMSGAVTMLAISQVTKEDDPPSGLVKDLRKATPKAGPLDALTSAERFDRPLAATTEQAVAAYNKTHRPNPLAVLTPREGTLLLDHPYAVTTTNADRRAAAEAFQDALGARSSRDILQRFGFRTPEGEMAPDQAERLDVGEKPPEALRLPSQKEIDRAVKSWR